MLTEEEILALYEWTAGACFRCSRADTETTAVGQIRPRSGELCEIRACRNCVLALEAERRRDAELHGREYAPGRIGDS